MIEKATKEVFSFFFIDLAREGQRGRYFILFFVMDDSVASPILIGSVVGNVVVLFWFELVVGKEAIGIVKKIWRWVTRLTIF